MEKTKEAETSSQKALAAKKAVSSMAVRTNWRAGELPSAIAA
jgi:hypothetical protein